MTANYEPFGEEWKKEISKLPKSSIIDIAAEIGKEKDTYICEFTEWLVMNGWVWSSHMLLWRRINRVTGVVEQYTTSQLREDWEVEAGRRVK